MTETLGAALPAGAAGYGADADALVAQYESVGFEQVQGGLLHLFPPAPARVLDVGAGSGRDAAALAGLGHTVTAVEPTAELRERGRLLHADAAIRWVDDALPGLPVLGAPVDRFDLILLTAVWMHLDAAERAEALGRLAGLLAPGGLLVMSVRSGPVPAGRRMFEVPPQELPALAERAGLRLVHRGERTDLHGRADVRWLEWGFLRP
ncbi:class I SAM-dependent methyltransferase [Kitasatospora mediocidica]|uniref:class I SAM-dependent methyltransferase n=1 Tax=Kitasatospora mediocidica TaxID=58352 RepID=UPI001E5ABA79|nr:class I SAM-dependent methyltransferase [Kitasatospora mediocidica]